MRLAPSLVVVAPIALTLGLAGPVAAKSCISHAYERLAVEVEGVYEGDRKVKAPPELGALDELFNSSGRGKSVLFWHAATMGSAKFYALDRAFPPTPAVASYLDSSRGRTLLTGCGYHVSYTPLVPGRYVFQEEHGDGSKVSKGIAEPVLLVAPGRDVVELRFRVGDRRYRAVYRVRCASFEYGADKGRCAPSERTADLEAVLASAMAQGSGAAGPTAEAAAPKDEAPPPSEVEASPMSEPAREPPRVIASPPEEPPATAGGCRVEDPGGPGLILLAWILLWRRRSAR